MGISSLQINSGSKLKANIFLIFGMERYWNGESVVSASTQELLILSTELSDGIAYDSSGLGSVSFRPFFILLRYLYSHHPRKYRADDKIEVSPYFSYCFATNLSYAIDEYFFSFDVIYGHILQ